MKCARNEIDWIQLDGLKVCLMFSLLIQGKEDEFQGIGQANCLKTQRHNAYFPHEIDFSFS